MSSSSMFKGKTVLITGGTGFLGRCLIKHILPEDPHAIRAFSRDEVKHHKLQELFDYDDRLRCLIGDVRDYERLKKASKGADIVIHAAANKRIDILEYNVEEAIKTNILGTLNMVSACLESDVDKAVFVSTDKACAPINTYGACKFVSERIFTESNYSRGSARTRFISVRYGNVLESTGSVIPFFLNKIDKGEPIPLTDEEMTRFIITPDQAANLILTALENAVGGEVFVPKLPAFKITDLIEVLKEVKDAANPTRVIGVRPGEKIHELMINESEAPHTFELDGYYVIRPQIGSFFEKLRDDPLKRGLRPFDRLEYSSNDSLVNKEEIKRIFGEIGLI